MIQQISLRAKVLATIASLLILLGVVAYFGYSGLLGVTEIAGRTSAAHGIVESLLEARRHEKNLIIRADDAYRESALQAIAKVKQRASDLKDRSPDDGGRATMDAVITAAAAYESAFRELASVSVAGNAQESALNALAKKTVQAARATEEHCAAAISALSREMAEVSASASRRILTLATLALVLGIAAALLLVRDLRVSFARATASAQAMATGNLTLETMPVGLTEIGRLGQAFNELRAHVESMLRSTTGTVATVAVSAQKVHSSAEEISQTIDEVSLQVSSVASASTEMAGASEEIARNCEMAAQSAMSATQTALNGSAIVDRQIQLMRQIAGTVDASSKSVSSLGERSVQIGTIIGTIHEIADQTNLLALNAAIEAARAGEQGRGFAVVADEVRKLAERTTKETHEISLMIKTIQEETESAVAAMQNGMRQVDAGTAEAANSEAALREIIAQIETVSTQVSHIAAAAEEQTAATEEISGNMHSIAAAVDQAANECRASTQVANGMTGVAEQLMSGMAKFTLNEDTTLSLQKAKSAHMIFIGKIKAHLDGALKLDATALPTHLNCGFGKWYQEQAKTSCGRMEVFKAIDTPHARVHQLGRQAVEAHAAGDAQQARALCNEMQACSMALVAMLDDMLAAPCTSS